MELNMGYAAYLGRISPEDSAIVTCLLKAGAVVSRNLEHRLFAQAHSWIQLYTRTNIPQTLMWVSVLVSI